MKQFTVIGLGSFGFTLACELYNAGHEVIVIDSNESLINKIKENVTHAIIADVRKVDNLKDFINEKTDAVILNLGESLEETVLVTMAVKNLGVKKVIVKVSNEEHITVLEKLGASEIIIPEKDYARQMSKRLTNENLLDFLPLTPEYGIYELALPDKFTGKSLKELNMRKKYNVSVIAVRDILHDNIVMNPGPDFKFLPDSVLYLLGKSGDISGLKKM
ncbi:MAG: TrkA family potassium uptake protein [Spirochaetes bacterium]|nr:TrkA family potassium uptake protein [Spirochaetota bacterium]